MTLPPLGRIRPYVRRLNAAPDPIELFRAAGAGPHRFLLESADRTSGSEERSLIGVGSALHLTASVESTTVTALSPNGEAALAWLATRLPDAVRLGSTLTVAHPRPDGPVEEVDRFRRPSPFDLLRLLAFEPRLTVRPNPWCHLLVGLIGYDAIDCFERLPPGRPDPLDQPTFEFWVPEALVVVDHRQRSTTIVVTTWGGPGVQARQQDAALVLAWLVPLVARIRPRGPVQSRGPIALGSVAVDQSDERYGETVGAMIEHLRAGDIYQGVPSRTFSLPCPDPLEAYRQLRIRNPSPYLFYLAGPTRTVFGASPETCLRVDGPARQAVVAPIAGTAPRGVDRDGRSDPDADRRNEVSLRHDAKEQAEHMMLIDLARNDIARISQAGTREVSRLLAVERYAHVMHLVSEVSGTLQPGIDALEAYAATMPMGTLVGAPKLKAAELLRRYEPKRRGAYGGGVGYLRDDGTLETAIVIRSAVVQDGTAHVTAGAGVVLDSNPLAEARETSRKARAVLEAIVAARPVGAPEVAGV